MKKMSTRTLVEAGVMIALAQILSYIKLYELPNGGAITAGSMIPILFFAIRWGVKPGLLAGTVYGVLQFLLGGSYVIHPLSILLDYVLAFGLLGLAGLFSKSLWGVYLGVFTGIFGRFVSSVLSGVILFASYAPPGMNPWIYSIGYNGSYLGVEFITSCIIATLLYKKLKAIPT
ncbi:MAG: energy-coupled thiamine transporter ThiT [Lutisporaceae bacterium]